MSFGTPLFSKWVLFMFDINLANSRFNPFQIIKTQKYYRQEIKNNPDAFRAFGELIICGEMGSGKSLTAHKLIKNIIDAYPKVCIVSNVSLGFCDYVPYTGLKGLYQTFEKRSLAGEKDHGIILFLDEIINQFPSTNSKDISDEWVAILQLLRKMRLLIIGTGPIFSRLAKQFRETFEYVCFCEQRLNIYGAAIQYNTWYRCNVETKILGDSNDEITHNMQVAKREIYTISVDDLTCYDTSELVKVIHSEDRTTKRRRTS